MQHPGRDQPLTSRDRGKRDRRGIAGGFAVSLVLHGAVLAAVLLRLAWEPVPETLPPPAPFNMVFEGGHPEQPATSEPSPVPSVAPKAPVGGAPGEQPSAPAEAAPPPPASPPPAPVPLQPTPEAVPPPPLPPPPVPPTPAPEPTPPAPEPAPPPLPPPPAPAPTPPPTGPSDVTMPPPVPVLPPRTPERPPSPPPPAPPPPAPSPPAQTELKQTEPKQTAPKQPVWPPRRQASPEKPKSDFPAPMDFSFGPGSAPLTARPEGNLPGKPALSLGLSHRGLDDSTPYSLDTDAEVGPDWRNALSEWVDEHAYYPHEALQMGQQGSVQVLVKTMPDGRVVSVELEQRSGSPWLDLALQGMFRGAKLPPLPKSAGNDVVPFHFTMHYILVH